jgi:hypothetical protein
MAAANRAGTESISVPGCVEPDAPPTQASPGEWLTTGRFALLLAGLIFAAFPQVVLGLQTFVVRDFGFFAYPLAHYQRECFWRGELPQWNPYNNCGVPFLAQWNTMPLYPPALFYLVLPLSWSLGFFCLLHLFFAGLGMYCLAHRWTGARLAASVAGLLFAFNGLSLNLLMWPSHIATLSWMPWVVLCVERAWREGGRRLVLAALAGAMQMLAGGPETILFTWLTLAALWIVQLVRSPRPTPAAGLAPAALEPATASRSALLWRFPLIVLLVAGLAAIQLLPFLDLAAHSQRDGGYADTRWSMPAWGWANFLVPMVFGHVWSMGVFFQYDQSWTSSYYLGMGTLLLALLAIWTVRERRVRLLAVAAGVALVLAMGDQAGVCRWLRRLVPQLALMTYPIKFVTVVAFAAPLLAAFGLARLVRPEHDQDRAFANRLRWLGGLLLALVGGILLWAWRCPFPADDFPATLRNGLLRGAFLVLATLLLATIHGSCRRRRKEALSSPSEGQSLLTSSPTPGQDAPPTLMDGGFPTRTHEPQQNPTVPASVYEPGLMRTKLAMQPQPALGESRAMVSSPAELKFMQFIMSKPSENLLIKRLGYFADCNLLDGVPKVNGFLSLYPRECGELASVLYGSTNANFPRLADFMSVSQMTAPGKVFDWVPRDSFLPLATAGQKPVFLDDTNALRSLIRPTFDPRKLVYLPLELQGEVSVTNQTRARVLSQRFSAQRVELEVDAAAPSLVVLSQTYYHPWRASVDGQPTRLFRANYAFQAVEVPAGQHRVRLVYHDHALYAGALISGVAVLLCLGFWLRARPVDARS